MSKTIRIGDIVEVRLGFQAREAVEADPSGVCRLIQLGDFRDGKPKDGFESRLLQFSPERMDAVEAISDRDVLYLAKGTKRFAYHPGVMPSPTLAANCFHVLRTGPCVLPEYLVWFLNHPDTGWAFRRVVGAGTLVPIVKKSDLEDLEIRLPSLATQHKIVELNALGMRQVELLDELKNKKRDFVAHATMRWQNTGHHRNTPWQTIKPEPRFSMLCGKPATPFVV